VGAPKIKLMLVGSNGTGHLFWGNTSEENYISQSAAMSNRPSTPSQVTLTVLRDLACDQDFSNWIVIMLVISIPIAFGIAVSGLISSFIDIFIGPSIVIILGDLQSWMIPLGGMVYNNGRAIANGIYLGAFLAELIKFISNIIVLFCIVLGLKILASRPN
jgi:large-conductance mechanosensitive channel